MDYATQMGPRAATLVKVAPAHSRVTWLEMAIAYETHTGRRIGLPHHDLHDKATILHTTFTAYLRKCKIKEGSRNTIPKVFPPHSYIDSLSALCHDLRALGIRRRPIFDDDTNHTIATHILLANERHRNNNNDNAPFGTGSFLPAPNASHPAYIPWESDANYQLRCTILQVNKLRSLPSRGDSK